MTKIDKIYGEMTRHESMTNVIKDAFDAAAVAKRETTLANAAIYARLEDADGAAYHNYIDMVQSIRGGDAGEAFAESFNKKVESSSKATLESATQNLYDMSKDTNAMEHILSRTLAVNKVGTNVAHEDMSNAFAEIRGEKLSASDIATTESVRSYYDKLRTDLGTMLKRFGYTSEVDGKQVVSKKELADDLYGMRVDKADELASYIGDMADLSGPDF